MEEQLTPEQQRARLIEELKGDAHEQALRKAINLELKAEAIREMEWESDEEYTILAIQEMEQFASYSFEEVVASLDGKPVYHPPAF
jgi:hypothetical protein